MCYVPILKENLKLVHDAQVASDVRQAYSAWSHDHIALGNETMLPCTECSSHEDFEGYDQLRW